MTDNHIGTLTFEISPEALRRIISEGRLAEFASKAAAHAAAQVNAPVVDLASEAALENIPVERAYKFSSLPSLRVTTSERQAARVGQGRTSALFFR